MAGKINAEERPPPQRLLDQLDIHTRLSVALGSAYARLDRRLHPPPRAKESGSRDRTAAATDLAVDRDALAAAFFDLEECTTKLVTMVRRCHQDLTKHPALAARVLTNNLQEHREKVCDVSRETDARMGALARGEEDFRNEHPPPAEP